ncbi:MAG: hypothetical protein ACT6QT_07915 [Sphingopyxis sp.]|uniref:hypothetical protein n=2 Tax=Alphaproteobacteria TaxID=28211 RepID=UPI003F70C33F
MRSSRRPLFPPSWRQKRARGEATSGRRDAAKGTYGRSIRNYCSTKQIRPIAQGVEIIETRILIAYGLILLLVAAGIAGIAFLRHNRHDRRIARQRAREQVRRDERRDAASRPD